MTDSTLRCALIYRQEVEGDSSKYVPLAKFDHAGSYETSSGSADETQLYGGRDTDYSNAVSMIIANDPPGGLIEAGAIGGFKVVQSDQHQVIYGASNEGTCYAVITGLAYPSRVAIQALEDLSTNFSAKFSSELKTCAEGSLTKKGKKILKEFCTKYENADVDKTVKLLGKVDEVKSKMQDNIASMLKNTEKTEDLVDKSDQLNEQAMVFKKKSTDLKKQMKWKNLKMTLILAGVIILISLIILVPLITRAKKLAASKNGN